MPEDVTPTKADTTVAARQAHLRELLLEQFKKVPIVHTACEKVGVGRATYYRWRKDDKEFASAADEALDEGRLLMNDMAESQLLSAIRDQNMTAIIFWLKNRHVAYTPRLQVTAKTETEESLTPEQEETIREALRHASLLPSPSNHDTHTEEESGNPEPDAEGKTSA